VTVESSGGFGLQLLPVSRATAEHYTWGHKCDGWHLVSDEQLSVIEEEMPPGTSEVLHYHGRAQQFFFVLSGEAVMDVGDREIRLTAREGLHIPPGIRHQIRNVSTEPVQFLVISQPPSHGDRVIAGTAND
jgi:mannose-6-phosphate isomerase-like protein (cupin superfamily)